MSDSQEHPQKHPREVPYRASGSTIQPSEPGRVQAVYELSVENSRKVDALAHERFGIPSIVLMENAGSVLANHAIELLGSARDQRVVIAAGPGNNGGDGFVAARFLSNHGYDPLIVNTAKPDQIFGDAKINLDIITNMNIPYVMATDYLADSSLNTKQAPGLIIDALFGTGLRRPVSGVGLEMIGLINTWRAAGSLVLAADVPSGLCAQSGHPMGQAVIEADRTVSFASLKDGYRSIEAQPYLGHVFVAPIGIPVSLLDELGRVVKHPQDK